MIEEFNIEKVESLDFDKLQNQLQYIFKTEQDIVNFINFLKNIQNFVSLSNDKRHITCINLAYFRSQIQLYEKRIQAVIDKTRVKKLKASIKKAKGAGEKITENIIEYYSEDDNVLDGLIDLHNLISAWSAYMQDLYFMLSQTNKNLGNMFN